MGRKKDNTRLSPWLPSHEQQARRCIGCRRPVVTGDRCPSCQDEIRTRARKHHRRRSAIDRRCVRRAPLRTDSRDPNLDGASQPSARRVLSPPHAQAHPSPGRPSQTCLPGCFFCSRSNARRVLHCHAASARAGPRAGHGDGYGPGYWPPPMSATCAAIPGPAPSTTSSVASSGPTWPWIRPTCAPCTGR